MPFTPSEIDYWDYLLKIARTEAEDNGDRELLDVVEKAEADLEMYSIISPRQRLTLQRFFDKMN